MEKQTEINLLLKLGKCCYSFHHSFKEIGKILAIITVYIKSTVVPKSLFI